MKKLLLIITVLLSSSYSFAQVGIGTATPDPSAALHLKSSGTQGFIVPRMSTSDRDENIREPKAGILIFNTSTVTFQVSQGITWFDINTNATTPVEIGTSSNTGGIVGVGTTSPDANTALDVVSATKGLLLPLNATDPTGAAGMIYYNTTTNRVKGFTTGWIDLFFN
jgi:hypothetical protein